MSNKALSVAKRRNLPALIGPAIVEELKSLADKKDGLLMPEAVVEAARNEDSPLHNRFEWDDGEAAERYRLWQARLLINVSVQYIDDGHNKQVPTKVFVSLSTDRPKGGYRVFIDVMSDDDQRNQFLADSLQAMRHFEEKYKKLSELGEVFETMQRTALKLRQKLRKH